MPFFAETAEGQIISPELEDYRAHLAGIRVKQSDGGKNGAAKTNGKNKSSETIADKGFQGDSGNPAGKSRVEPRVSSTVQARTRLLYPPDAAGQRSRVDLGGGRVL